jgi:hypothetical protein
VGDKALVATPDAAVEMQCHSAALSRLAEALAPVVLLLDECEALFAKPSKNNNMINAHAAFVRLFGRQQAMPMMAVIAITNSQPNEFSPQLAGRFMQLEAPPLEGRSLINAAGTDDQHIQSCWQFHNFLRIKVSRIRAQAIAPECKYNR